MRKLKLDLDDLQVTSFETQPAAEPRKGTVFGLQPHIPTPQTQQESCAYTYCHEYTCNFSCGDTCTYAGPAGDGAPPE